jgi:nitrate reductase gamma subunit
MHNITLSPFPHNNTQVVGIFATEVIFLKSLFKSDFVLWIGAWLMHIALLNVLGGHLVGFYFLGKQFIYIGMSEDLSVSMSNLLGTTFGIVLFFALLYLLYRRMSIQKVREVTVTSDYLHLILLLSIVSVGNIMRLYPDWGLHYEPVKEYVTHLVMLQPIPAGAEVLHKPLFAIHLLLVQILLVVFPFSKLMHVLGMFAERWIINRPYTEPAPGIPNIDIPAARAAGLGLPSEGGVE